MMFNPVYEIHQCVLVLLLIHVETTEASTSGMPWPNADQIIQTVCPTTSICNVPKSVTGLVDNCCTACTCGNGCGDRQCCFRTNTKSDYEICLYLQSKSNNFYRFTPMEERIWSYYVVSKAPDEGCYETKGSCNSSDTNTIFPVFSQQTGNIYFNKECALCHGVDKVIDPKVTVLCDNLGTAKDINVDKELEKLLGGDKSSFCFLYFEFPDQNTSPRECAIHAVEDITSLINITNEDYLRENYNMTIDDIAKACISDLFSPVLHAPKKKLYPNPFCYLLGEGTHSKDTCYTMTGISIEFVMLLNPDLHEVLRRDRGVTSTYKDEVCTWNNSLSLSLKYETCRPVFCPIGHIVNKNGECTFITNRIVANGRMNRWLNLILTSTGDALLNESTLGIISIEYLCNVLKLPDAWDIIFWGISAEPNVHNTSQIIIIIKLDNLKSGLINGLPSIRSHLDKSVFILDEPYKLSVYQKKMYVHEKRISDILKVPLCSVNNTDAEITNDEKVVSSCWNIMGFNPELSQNMLIDFQSLSKLHFCDVVHLTTFEYHLDTGGLLLYNRIVSRYLYDNEFLLITDSNGETFAKICLEDSGFSKLDVNAAFKADASILIIVILLSIARVGRTFGILDFLDMILRACISTQVNLN